jgi:hypothetical protein
MAPAHHPLLFQLAAKSARMLLTAVAAVDRCTTAADVWLAIDVKEGGLLTPQTLLLLLWGCECHLSPTT